MEMRKACSSSSQGYCTDDSSGGDSSWTDSSFSNDSVALCSYPPPTHPASTHTSLNCSNLPEHHRGYRCGSVEFTPAEKNLPYRSDCATRNGHFGVNRSVYHQFPPYRDKQSGGILDMLVESCALLSSLLPRPFRGTTQNEKCLDPESIPLLMKETSENRHPGRGDFSDLERKRYRATEVRIEPEGEYEPPPNWKNEDYLEWLGLLRHLNCTSPEKSPQPADCPAVTQLQRSPTSPAWKESPRPTKNRTSKALPSIFGRLRHFLRLLARLSSAQVVLSWLLFCCFCLSFHFDKFFLDISIRCLAEAKFPERP